MLKIFVRLYVFLCSHFQPFEVWVRHCYYFFLKGKVNISKLGNEKPKRDVEELDKSLLFSYVDSLGIKNGDILIVHSSMDALSQFEVTPKEIIDWLLNIVGPEGTLCMPAFPMYRDKDYSIDEVTGEQVITYDVKKTPCWTGMLPNLFIRYPGVIRSEFPYNPLAAKGKHAIEMMKDNLLGDKPHGIHSSWDYCVNHDAKILYLGCPMYHSLTIVHIREDLDDSFPVRGWYKSQVYQINNGASKFTFPIYERKQIWSKYFTEMYCERILTKKLLADVKYVGGVPISFIRSTSKLREYIFKQDIFRFIFFKLPKKFDMRRGNI